MHRVGRALLGAAAVLVTAVCGSLALASPAAADAGGGAVSDDSGIDYGAIEIGTTVGGGSPGTPGRSTGPVCTYRLMGGPDGFPVYDESGNLIPTTPGGNWYEKICDGVFYGAVYLTGAPDAVDPAVVAAGVLQRMDIPVPEVSSSPAGDQIVNLASWFWIPNWQPITGTATVGGVTVTVTARPTSARWSFGDGSTSTCAPGVAWSGTADPRQACTHTWLRSTASQPGEAYRLSVTVTWTAAFTVTGGAGGGPLTPVSRTATAQVRVAEVQAITDRAGG